MRCPDCGAEVNDEDDRCPECGMFLIDSEWTPDGETPGYAPMIFSAASVLLGAVSLGFWILVVKEQIRCFLPLFLFLPLIGYGLGRKGLSVPRKWTALAGTILNMLAIAIFLVYVVYRAGSGESPFWL